MTRQTNGRSTINSNSIVRIVVKPRPRQRCLYVRVCTSPLNMMKKLPPASESFARPDPEAARDAHNHGHQVLDHEHFEVRFPTKIARPIAHRARYGVESLGSRSRAHFHIPCEHPVVEVGLFVEKAGDNDKGGHCVKNREDTDANHQLLELVGLRAVVLHDRANAEQRDETRQQKHGAEDKIDAERS